MTCENCSWDSIYRSPYSGTSNRDASDKKKGEQHGGNRHGVDNKTQAPAYTSNKTQEVIESGTLQALQRQREARQKRIVDVQAAKLKFEEAKFTAGVSLEDLNMWSVTVDAQLVNVDVEVVMLGKYIEQLILTEENKKLEEAAAKEAQAVATSRAEQLQLEESLLWQKLQYEQRLLEARENSNETTTKAAEMPKLVISKFSLHHPKKFLFWKCWMEIISSSRNRS